MPDLDDQQLLRDFAETRSETAFATLVARHVNLVYSTALRFSGNPNHAEEITQAVFVILARKADGWRHGVVLSGWLYQTARLTAANVIKSELRRQRREQEACMQSISNEPDPANWIEIAPLLDDAMGRLGETDRNAVVLSFFENKTAREVAAALQLSEAATRKRVERALDKLRNFFSKHGVTSTTAVIAGAISANSVHAAPVGLAKSVTALAAIKGAAASASTATLIEGALRIMAWTKTKTTIVAGVALLLAAGAGTVAVEYVRAQNLEKLWRINKPLPPAQIDKLPPMVKVLPTKFGPPWTDLSSNTNGDKFVGARARAGQIAAYAYSFPRGRIRFASAEPTNLFDFVATLPQGSREALQSELKAKFALVGRREMETMDVLLLRVRYANAPGLKPAIPNTNDHQVLEMGRLPFPR